MVLPDPFGPRTTTQEARFGDQADGGEQRRDLEHLADLVGHDPASRVGFCGHVGHLRVALHRSS